MISFLEEMMMLQRLAFWRLQTDFHLLVCYMIVILSFVANSMICTALCCVCESLFMARYEGLKYEGFWKVACPILALCSYFLFGIIAMMLKVLDRALDREFVRKPW